MPADFKFRALRRSASHKRNMNDLTSRTFIVNPKGHVSLKTLSSSVRVLSVEGTRLIGLDS